jgi:Ku protein
VNYKRVAERDGKEVRWDQIVKGYEYEKGKYVVLKDEDFQRVDLEATQTIDIQDFVDQEEIDPVFFYKPYYLERRQSLRGSARCTRKEQESWYREGRNQNAAISRRRKTRRWRSCS